MSRYNHFAKEKYEAVNFNSIPVDGKFRMDKFDRKRRRSDIIMIKTGLLSYKEAISGKEYALFSDNIMVRSYDKLLTP